MKPVALAVSVHAAEKAEAIAAVKLNTKPTESVSPYIPVESGSADEPDWELIDPGYHPFVSRGFVSMVGSDKKVPVTILRHSVALDSFILESVLPFSSDGDTGGCTNIQGMGLNVLTVPLHNLFLSIFKPSEG